MSEANHLTSVGLMARKPESGKVKTRLASAVGDEQALSIYKSLLARALNLLSELDRQRYQPFLFATGEGAVSCFRKMQECDFEVVAQSGGDLGQRMKNALDFMINQPSVSKTMLIGSDIPGLTREQIDSADDMLDEKDLVIGPCSDGGFYLIGMNKIHPELFQDIEYGSSNVLRQTLAAAESCRLKASLLSELRDLDEISDYHYFQSVGLVE